MATDTLARPNSNFDTLAKLAVTDLVERLSAVPDPRGSQGVLHRFTDILAILILASVCGCDDAEAVEEWAIKEEAWLRSFLPLRHGVPGQDTYLRALAAMEPQAFQTVFRQWAQAVCCLLGLTGQLAVDGKTVRGARKTGQAKSPVHLVSALACDAGLVVGQVRTEEKSNEITAMPELLRMLSLHGTLVSSDAMGCQVDIAQTIVDQGGDYLFGLKGNQPTLNQETAELFQEADDPRRRTVDEAPRPRVEQDEQVEAGHGRIERRIATVCHDAGEWVPATARFPELRTFIRINATVADKVTGATTQEFRYYISSRHMSAREANRAVRAHWAVENRLHWCLDTTFSEDACRIRTKNAAENLAVIRHFALSWLRCFTEDRLSLPRRRRRCDYSLEYRMRVLASALG
ncbi:MAG: ISAs1 family transposase [Polyangia bacterium]|nr:ISAs1 family transposase [Polyangia bacterium]